MWIVSNCDYNSNYTHNAILLVYICCEHTITVEAQYVDHVGCESYGQLIGIGSLTKKWFLTYIFTNARVQIVNIMKLWRKQTQWHSRYRGLLLRRDPMTVVWLYICGLIAQADWYSIYQFIKFAYPKLNERLLLSLSSVLWFFLFAIREIPSVNTMSFYELRSLTIA